MAVKIFLKKFSPTMDVGLRADVCSILLQQGVFVKIIVKLLKRKNLWE